MANGKKAQPAGWGGDDKETEKPKVEPLTDKEIYGLRTILDRHGYDRENGKF
jgi:hypothetical protein